MSRKSEISILEGRKKSSDLSSQTLPYTSRHWRDQAEKLDILHVEWEKCHKSREKDKARAATPNAFLARGRCMFRQHLPKQGVNQENAGITRDCSNCISSPKTTT